MERNISAKELTANPKDLGVIFDGKFPAIYSKSNLWSEPNLDQVETNGLKLARTISKSVLTKAFVFGTQQGVMNSVMRARNSVHALP